MSLGLAALVMLASATGDALPGVVLLAPDEAKASSFVENMRIQLTGMASVTLGPPDASGSTEERAARARLYLDTTGASIAVWKELRRAPRTGAVQIVVLAVTRDVTRRAIEVARVDATRGDEAERVLALKVGELLYRVLATASSEQELAAALEKNEAPALKPPPEPPPAKPSPAPPPRLRLRALFEGGVGLRADSGLAAPQVTVRGALGGALQKGDLRVELTLGARRFTELQLRAANGSLVLREVGAGGEARALKLLPPFAVGAHVGVMADILGASATALDGRQGSATKLGSSLSGGPELRLAVFPVLEMRTRVAIETTLYDQRFAIEGIEVEGGESPRLSGEISLIYWIP